jgi:DNA gyrase subunit A
VLRTAAAAAAAAATGRSSFVGNRIAKQCMPPTGRALLRGATRPLTAAMSTGSGSAGRPPRSSDIAVPGGGASAAGRPGALSEAGLGGAPPADGGERPAGIVPSDLRREMSRSYMEYAMSVILGRALPDIRDGLKPVHRRILYAMHVLGITSSGPYRKCARVVGEVLGKYHPHGDTAVYDALVRMAQDFSMGIPLIDGHGNFGSTDGDPAAAMRYTECRLSTIAKEGFLEDLDRETVDFGDNFDGSEREPLVMPTRVPNLLVNGSSGIAVGMATNVPPHNLGELVNALVALIEDPELEDAELVKFVPAPDFPTGGQILGVSGARELYMTGRGRVLMRAKAHFDVLDAGGPSGRKLTRDAIIVTELPYQVNKALLVEKIAELVNDKKLDGIADLRDESDRNGTRIVIELKRDAERAVVLNNLYKRTSLQHAFSGNMLALDGGRSPVRFTLRECLTKFLDFRRDVVRRRTKFELARAAARLHIVDGFIVAQRSIDGVIALIRSSGDAKAATVGLEGDFGLSAKQAEAVLSMQLRRLTAMEQSRLECEGAELRSSIEDYGRILDSVGRVNDIIVKELKREASKHSRERRSAIVRGEDLDAAEIDELSLVANDQCVIVVTQQGYIKRMLTTEFESQNRGTRGKRGVGNTRDKDVVLHFFSCRTHDMLVAISQRGIAYGVPAHKVPIGSRTSRGTPIFQILSDATISAGETMASVLPVSEFRDNEYMALLTKGGNVKKTALSAFEKINSRGKIIISLQDGDELKWVRLCVDTDSMIVASRSGKAVRIAMDAQTVRPSGRTSQGVRSMTLKEGDEIVSMDILHGVSEEEDSRYLLAVTSDGLGKRVEAKEFRKVGRGAKGVIALKFKARTEARLLALTACNDGDSVMIVTKRGTIVRQAVSSISARSRRSMPILLQRLDAGDEVAAVTILPAELVDSDGLVDEEEDAFAEA